MEKQKQKEGTMQRLLALATPEAPSLLGSVALLGVYSSITLSIPSRLGALVDLSHRGGPDAIQKHCTRLIGLFCLGGLANFARQYLVGCASERIISRLRKDLFAKLVSQPMAFFDCEENRTAELISRLTNDTEKIGKTLTDSLLQGVKNIGQTLGALGIMFQVSPTLAVLLFCMLPPVALSAVTYGHLARRLEREAGNQLANKGIIAEEFLSNIRIVIAFGEERRCSSRYSAVVNSVVSVTHSAVVASASYQSFLQTSGYCVVLSLLWMGGLQVSRGRLTVGDLTSLLMYTVFGGVGIMGCGNFAADMMKGLGTASRMFELMDLPDAQAQAEPAESPLCETYMLPSSSVGGELRVEGVTFRYPSRPSCTVWNDVSFSIPSGSCCAVVGHSGAGKSTLVNLLLKLYTPEQGMLKLEGVDLRDIPSHELRKLVAYVPQDPLLFGDSVLNNILFGVTVPEGVDPRQLAIAAARRTNAHEFITGLKDGYDTYVGEKGSQLSGGQRQRIAIARALAKDMSGNSRIIVFDEATTGLDPVNKAALQESIQSVMLQARKEGEESRRRTVICLTHDEALLRTCDYVVAFQGGEVALCGPYPKVGADLSPYIVTMPTMEEQENDVVLSCQ